MVAQIIQCISNACSCTEADAQSELDAVVRNLKELSNLGSLRDSDFEDACSGLGLELDFVTYFIEAIA